MEGNPMIHLSSILLYLVSGSCVAAFNATGNYAMLAVSLAGVTIAAILWR